MSTKQDHKRWRKAFNESCLKRDKKKCVFCNVTEDLDVHHITDRHDMPNGGYAPSNGISLCNEHHLLAEEWHATGSAREEYSANSLYKKIGSSYQKAHTESQNLK
jgi:predicted restriction endonuclease